MAHVMQGIEIDGRMYAVHHYFVGIVYHEGREYRRAVYWVRELGCGVASFGGVAYELRPFFTESGRRVYGAYQTARPL